MPFLLGDAVENGGASNKPTETLAYHINMAGNFQVYAASRGEGFNGVVNIDHQRPLQITVSLSNLRKWHYLLRGDEFDGIEGIATVKQAVVAAGGSMEPPKQYAELSDVPDLLQRYKDFRGDRFDGTIYQKDIVPGIGSIKFIHRWLHKIIDGEYDMEDGIAEVKAKARKMGYLITTEDFLDMLQMYVEAEGRIGRVRKGVVILSL